MFVFFFLLVGVGSNHSNFPSVNRVGSYSDDSDDACSKLIITPNFSRKWVPNCEDVHKPHLGKWFASFEDAYDFYEAYARMGGFVVRRGTSKIAKGGGENRLKYYLCHRQGFVNNQIEKSDSNEGDSSRQHRKKMFSRCGCKAMIALKWVGKNVKEGVVVYTFVEAHNHKLVGAGGRHFLKSSREMSIVHKTFAFDASKVKIGPSQAYGLMKEMVGGYENVGATVTDFRNWNRDLKEGIGKKDAQIILDKFKAKKEEIGSFYYEYDTDPSGHLTKLFWADPIGRRNYEVFGDVISFDATFGTNK